MSSRHRDRRNKLAGGQHPLGQHIGSYIRVERILYVSFQHVTDDFFK